MFNFETTTIINSLTDPGFAGKTAHNGVDTIAAHPRFWVDNEDITNPVLRIAKGGRFAKNNIKHVTKRAWEAPEYFTIQFDMTKATAAVKDGETNGLGRLEIMVEVVNSNDVVYVDAYSRHRRPFTIEFPISAADKGNEADLAKKVARIANKYGQLIQGNTLLEVMANGTDVIVTATDEYLQVHEASLSIYNEQYAVFDCCSYFGDFEHQADGIVVNQGKPGYGTYRQLVKDIFLPTNAHRDWANPFEDEAPILGGHYNEYTITLCVERPGLGGLSAVGQQVVSTTVHTFYVLDNGGNETTNPSKVFESLLNEVADATIATTADKDYDDVTLSKEDLEDSTNDSTKIREVQTIAQGDNLTDSASITEAAGLEGGKRKPSSK